MKINNFELISSIIRGTWFIDENIANSYIPIIQNILEKNNDFEIITEHEKIVSSSNGVTVINSVYKKSFDDAPQNSVATISVNGALMKSDQMCGPVGMASIGGLIKHIDQLENIVAIVLKIDSPGGTVDGTETLSNIISQTKKPVVAFVDGLMASAALWIGSCANEIIASNDMDQIGSIGVMMSFADMQPALEKQGFKFHTILAEQSKDKNRLFSDLKDGKYDEYKKTVLNPLAERFIAAVKENRPNVKEKHLTGSMFFAKDVKGILVDDIATFDDAINRAYILGTTNGVANSGKNSQLANSEEKKNKIKVNSKNHVKMTKEELQSQHPALYNEIYSAGKKEGAKDAIAQERDRVGSFIAFLEIDPEGVKKGIESGVSMTETQRSEFAIKAHSKIVIEAEKKEGAEDVTTTKTVKTSDGKNHAEQLLDEELKNKGFNFKS